MPAAGATSSQLTDDQLLAMPAAGGKAVPPQPGLYDRLVGIGERGMVGGLEGVANTAQAAGRWADRNLPAVPGVDAVDQRIDNAPVSAKLDQALTALHPYAPQQASGKILQGAISGATGAALTGGLGAVPATFGAAVGAAVPIAKALGASDSTADDIGAGLSLLPVAGAAGMAARSVAGNVARNAFLGSVGRSMTPAEAADAVRAGSAPQGYQAGGASLPQAAAAYGSDLNTAVGQYRRAGQAAGLLDADDSRAIGQAAAQANGGAVGPGTAAAGVKAMGLPGYHQDAVEGGIGQLDALSRLPTSGPAVGPISSAVAKVAPVAAGLSALGAAHGGDYMNAAELAGGAIAGRTVASPFLRMVGTVGDKLLGTAMSPADARLQAAQRVVQQAGMDASGNPLGDLHSAVSDAQGTLRDTQLNALDNASQTTLSAQADAAWKQHAAQQAATDTAWQKALAQRDKQAAAGQTDVLSAALWRDAEQQQQSPNLAAVTASQAKGFQADQAGLARRDAQDAAAQQAAQARGQNLSEQAGAWMERQQMGAFKRANPGVPVTGAASLAATDPHALFEATAGRYGSPADPGQATLMQDAEGQFRQPPPPAGAAPSAALDRSPVASPTGALQGPPVGVPQGQAQGASVRPAGASTATPANASATPSLGSLPTGGLALAQMMHAERFPGQPLPSPAELHIAVDDLSADGLLHPFLADQLHAGANGPDRHVAANIADRVATSRGLPSILDPQMQGLNNAQAMFSHQAEDTSRKPPLPLQSIFTNPLSQ